jgi:hypothetical protein
MMVIWRFDGIDEQRNARYGVATSARVKKSEGVALSPERLMHNARR